MKRGTSSEKELRRKLLSLFGSIKDAEELRVNLESLSSELAFPGLTYLWGPELYRRNRLLFRPFLLSHFSEFAFRRYTVVRVAWKGPVAQQLQSWLDQVDADDDSELFLRLYGWKLRELSTRKAQKQWQSELLRRFVSAGERAGKQKVLSKFDLWYWLDEETAMKLYRHGAEASRDFILRHLPRHYSVFGAEKRKMWDDLAAAAQAEGDLDFYFQLYRRGMPLDQWKRDALKLCREEKDDSTLIKELQRRHPQVWGHDLGPAFAELLECRGPSLFPYIVPELRKVMRGWFHSGFGELMELAERRGWWDLWAALLRTCARPKEYNKTVQSVLKMPDQQARRRLVLLGGVGQEWNFAGFGLASANTLDDKTALAVYQRFPELLKGPLKVQVSPNWGNVYPRLLKELKRSNDEELLDYLASRLVTRGAFGSNDKLLQPVDELAGYYENLQSQPQVFARRAVNVLGQVPPYVFWNYNGVIRTNRLARLLYERSPESYLADPVAFSDLIEAPEIHSQILAYKALSLDREEARRLGRENFCLLLGTLLRPIHRRTRLFAFQALLNASRDDVDLARTLHDKARQALDLPDSHYPKDDLVHLIAKLLARFPELRQSSEEPVVYGASA